MKKIIMMTLVVFAMAAMTFSHSNFAVQEAAASDSFVVENFDLFASSEFGNISECWSQASWLAFGTYTRCSDCATRFGRPKGSSGECSLQLE